MRARARASWYVGGGYAKGSPEAVDAVCTRGCAESGCVGAPPNGSERDLQHAFVACMCQSHRRV